MSFFRFLVFVSCIWALQQIYTHIHAMLYKKYSDYIIISQITVYINSKIDTILFKQVCTLNFITISQIIVP